MLTNIQALPVYCLGTTIQMMMAAITTEITNAMSVSKSIGPRLGRERWL